MKNANNKGKRTFSTKSIAQDSYVFFKPYKKDATHFYLASYAIDSKGNLYNTTMIPYTEKDLSRIKKMILSKDILYFDSKGDIK